MFQRLRILAVAAILAAALACDTACRSQAYTAPATVKTSATSQAATSQASRPTTHSAGRRVHVFVSGQVQGVGFRFFTEAAAGKLGLTGWVRNLPDGRVEAVIEGPPDKLAALLDQMRKGPEHAKVDDLQVKDEPPTGEFHNFSTRSQ
jgi:acylphosphatase